MNPYANAGETIMQIVLASSSERRKRLLTSLGVRFLVEKTSAKEAIYSGESFPSAAMRLAEKKASVAAKKRKNSLIIAADTIAYFGKTAFRKAKSRKEAQKTLAFLSGKKHFVVTGVCVIFPGGKKVKYCEKAQVKMKKLGKKEIEAYLDSNEWKERAGCYDISGKGKGLVEKIIGEKETVIGLPLLRLKKILMRAANA